MDGNPNRSRCEGVGAAACHCPTCLGLCTSLALLAVRPSASDSVLGSASVRFVQLWLQSARCHSPTCKAWSRLHRLSDWVSAVRQSGQKSRASGERNRHFTPLCLKATRAGRPRTGCCLLRGPCSPRSMVPCLRRFAWKTKRRIPYIGWNGTIRNCCSRTSELSAAHPPKCPSCCVWNP